MYDYLVNSVLSQYTGPSLPFIHSSLRTAFFSFLLSFCWLSKCFFSAREHEASHPFLYVTHSRVNRRRDNEEKEAKAYQKICSEWLHVSKNRSKLTVIDRFDTDSTPSSYLSSELTQLYLTSVKSYLCILRTCQMFCRQTKPNPNIHIYMYALWSMNGN